MAFIEKYKQNCKCAIIKLLNINKIINLKRGYFMQLFNHAENVREKFYILPEKLKRNVSKEILSLALGGTLYVPAIKEGFSEKIINKEYKNLTSVIFCLEDSIADSAVEIAEENLLRTLDEIDRAVLDEKIDIDDVPWIFIRIRSFEQLNMLLSQKEKLKLVTGFVFPKVNSNQLKQYIDAVGSQYYIMPIFESSEIIYKESRIYELFRLKEILDLAKDRVLNVRIGVTDFSGLYSIRRYKKSTIYDNLVVSDCITDILNIYSRAEQGYFVSGSVWEHFSKENDKYFLREVELEKANGIIGKTVIHPSQIDKVNAIYTVTEEEYIDALNIVESSESGNNGVTKSDYKNKMNEVKPHYNWAKLILLRARIYGVLKQDIHYSELLE
jgi:citrate lyase beta subunit